MLLLIQYLPSHYLSPRTKHIFPLEGEIHGISLIQVTCFIYLCNETSLDSHWQVVMWRLSIGYKKCLYKSHFFIFTLRYGWRQWPLLHSILKVHLHKINIYFKLQWEELFWFVQKLMPLWSTYIFCLKNYFNIAFVSKSSEATFIC